MELIQAYTGIYNWIVRVERKITHYKKLSERDCRLLHCWEKIRHMTCVQRLKIIGMVVAWCDLPKNPRMDKLLRNRGDSGLCISEWSERA